VTVRQVLQGKGHPNILSTHYNTLAFTTEEAVTSRGDCFVAVAMDRSLPGLDDDLKDALRAGRRLRITIEADGVFDVVEATGAPGLTFEDPSDMVVRRSGYVCGRTLAIDADKAAKDLSRELVDRLRAGGPVRIVLECAPTGHP
jgi:hypothetical protein